MGLFFGKSRRRKKSRSLLASLPLIRWVGPLATVAAVMMGGGAVLSGKVDLSVLDMYRGVNPDTPPAQPVSLTALGNRSESSVVIATFNIENFGEAKANKPHVMETLAKIISRFDLVAIQELRNSPAHLERLIRLVNQNGGQYAFVASQPLGEPRNEMYAYVWDTRRIAFLPGSNYVVNDEADLMYREPMISSFETIPADPNQPPFRFTLMNVHTDPDTIRLSGQQNELNILDDVYLNVATYEYQVRQIDDFILLGDLNAPADGLGELGAIPEVVTLVQNMVTNTAKKSTLDHILIDRGMTTEYTGRFGVVDYERDLGMTREAFDEVSDHMPVWAEFSMVRRPIAAAQVASQPQTSQTQ